MPELKLYMLLLGCRPKGRNTEQHDIFFGVGSSLQDLIPAIKAFWPEAKGDIHIDGWREVTNVDGFTVQVLSRNEKEGKAINDHSLFFINLGGYKENEFEEYHYKILTVARSMDEAKLKSRQTAFYKHTGIKGAPSHIDDKFGVDADDVHEVKDILSASVREHYSIHVSAGSGAGDNQLHLAYLPMSKLAKGEF